MDAQEIESEFELSKPQLILLMGPPGAGKTTYSRSLKDYFRVNRDAGTASDDLFQELLSGKKNIVVDRLNQTRAARSKYLEAAKQAGYETKIVSLDQNNFKLLSRISNRDNTEQSLGGDMNQAMHAIINYRDTYERPEKSEADALVEI